MKHTQRLTVYTFLLVLLVLPVITSSFLSKDQQLYCLPVSFPARHSCGPPRMEIYDMRNYNMYTVSNDTSQNTRVLPQIRSDLHTIMQRKDTIHGIRIRVNDDAAFEAYIACLEICKENQAIFVNCGNYIYAFYVNRNPRTSGRLSYE